MKKLLLLTYLVAGLSFAYAQDPGAQQDALEERQKILKAADQIDLMTQQNSQLTQDVAALKDRVGKLETANTDLKTQLDQQKKEWATEKEKLLKEVSKLVASGGAGGTAASSSKAGSKTTKTATKSNTGSTTATPGVVATTESSGTTLKTEQGYEYVVQAGQSLWAIAEAYQKSGVNVTVDDIRKANNLGKNDVLKVGQKLFIPKK